MHEKYLKMTIEKVKEGRSSPERGSFGALIVKKGVVVCAVHNLVKGTNDLT